MRTLKDPNENEAHAVDARQELDLKVGVAFSRFQTQFFRNKYSDLDSSVISYGPCQIPTLGFCVDRFDLIQNFKGEAVPRFPIYPQHYWTLNVAIKKNSRVLPLSWTRGRLFDQEVPLSRGSSLVLLRLLAETVVAVVAVRSFGARIERRACATVADEHGRHAEIGLPVAGNGAQRGHGVRGAALSQGVH